MEENERFELLKDNFTYIIIDNKTEKALMLSDICNLLNKQNKIIKKLGQLQKQLAISELEKVLDNFRNRPTYFDVARQELCLSDRDKKFIDFINNQIKELKGE